MQDQTNIFNEYQSVKKCILLHIYRKQEDFNKAVSKDRYMCVCTWHFWKYTNTEFWYRYKPGSKCVCALTTPYTYNTGIWGIHTFSLIICTSAMGINLCIDNIIICTI